MLATKNTVGTILQLTDMKAVQGIIRILAMSYER